MVALLLPIWVASVLFAVPSLQLPPAFDFRSLVGILQGPGGGGNQVGPSSNFTGPPGNLTEVNQTVTVSEALQSNQSFSILTQALQMTNSTQLLNTTENYTIFAPINSAFETLPNAVKRLFQSSSNKTNEVVRALLLYHIVPQNLTLQSFGGGGGGNQTSSLQQTNETAGGNMTRVPTLLGNLTVSLSKDQNQTLMVNDARVVAEGNASNGNIFAIDRIITPLYFLNLSIYQMGREPGGGNQSL
ncbi:hypothetical protein HDU67_006894 [Dinochytrium kinnereticum]|nr:hypothetical protein HDU67_006894 [Dinochytrium kinnereticum]